MKKVVLIAPPEEYMTKDYLPHLGLGYIAAVLEMTNHEVQIMDAPILKLTVDDVIKKVQNLAPHIVGITATTHSRFNAIKILQGIRDLPCIKVLGGVHFSLTDVDALKHSPADIIVRGEGEYTLLEIVNDKPWETIRGITYRKDGYIVRNEDRPFIDLNTLPLPARHLFPMHKYNARLEGEYRTQSTSIITSRGCPNECIFCVNKVYWKRILRKRSPASVIDEIENIIETYNIRGFDFWDDTFTVDKNHATNICKEILRRNLDIVWYARVRTDTINEELLELMRKAGCIAISFGIESGSPRILQILKKNIDIKKAIKYTEICSKLGFYTKVFFMFNHPYETIEDVMLTIKLINRLRKFRNVHIATAVTTIYPGTEIEEIAKREHILPNDFIWNSPYYSERNAEFGLSPTVPYFEYIPFEVLFRVIRRKGIMTFIRNSIKELIYNDFATLIDKFNNKWRS